MNENSEYIISCLSGIANLNIYKSDGDKLKKIEVSKDYNIVDYSVDLSDKYFAMVWRQNLSGFSNKIFSKVYNLNGDLITDRARYIKMSIMLL